MDPDFADTPPGPVSEIVVTDDDREDWKSWQVILATMRNWQPTWTLVELADDGLSFFKPIGGINA